MKTYKNLPFLFVLMLLLAATCFSCEWDDTLVKYTGESCPPSHDSDATVKSSDCNDPEKSCHYSIEAQRCETGFYCNSISNNEPDLNYNYICQKEVLVIECGKGQIKCGDQCINPNNDSAHCGAKGFCNASDENSADYRGAVCNEETETCIDSKCDCRSGFARCDGVCVDGANDLKKCGAKGSCEASEAESENFMGLDCGSAENFECKNGRCNPFSCSAPQTLCRATDNERYNVCANTSNDPEHCGECGKACINEFLGKGSCKTTNDKA